MPLCIIVPCYNEANRFPEEQFKQFLSSHPTVQLILVNDGSYDNTLSLLTSLAAAFPQQVETLSLLKNQDKAVAVQEGMLLGIKTKFL